MDDMVIDPGPSVDAGNERLPAIPVIDAADAVALARAETARARALIDEGRRVYGGVPLALASRLSRRWLGRVDGPYGDELDAVVDLLGDDGAYMLNLSYEWCCTSGVAADPAGPGMRLLRALDWPTAGLGRHLAVARTAGAAGGYLNVTWPGFVGVLTALAPGRFAAALNQAPMRRRGLPLPLDWLGNRLGVWRRRGLPPTHLLRLAFDRCRSYAEARDLLCREPVALPVLYVLAGTEPGEGCLIERLEDRAFVHDAPAVAANHWQTPGLGGDPRGCESHQRHAHLAATQESAADGFDWLAPPVLNDCTRVAVVANAARGRLAVQGYEAETAVTRPLRLNRAGGDA